MGVIGGEARLADLHRARGAAICGSVLSRAITYSMAVLETNTSMGLIVAAPTAGSSGIVPGLLLALQEEYSIPDSRVIDALFNAGAIGYLAMRNADRGRRGGRLPGRGGSCLGYGRLGCRGAHGRNC